MFLLLFLLSILSHLSGSPILVHTLPAHLDIPNLPPQRRDLALELLPVPAEGRDLLEAAAFRGDLRHLLDHEELLLEDDEALAELLLLGLELADDRAGAVVGVAGRRVVAVAVAVAVEVARGFGGRVGVGGELGVAEVRRVEEVRAAVAAVL